jgi:hypothetical protein
MFFNSKPFKILLPFVAYLLFAGQLLYSYKLIWYANIPEETSYFKTVLHTVPQLYFMYVYLFAITLILFTIFALVYFFKPTNSRAIIWCLLIVIAFSLFYVWHFSVTQSRHYSMGVMMINLFLFVAAAFKFYQELMLLRRSFTEDKKQLPVS